MSETGGISNTPKKVNRLFLFLGILSLLFTPFDIAIESDYFGSFLNIAWGGFFIFLSFRERLKSKLSPNSMQVIQFILVAFIVIAGLSKFLYKLKIKGVF